MKCIILLSTKSSGSSSLQNYLHKNKLVKLVSSTRHNENETLYWTKAASVLGMHQVDLIASEVPLGQEEARTDLIKFLRENDSLQGIDECDDRDLIFQGWSNLCSQLGPVFFEKSPHHIYQRTAIDLIYESMNTTKAIDFLIVGLIRNPLDILYSHWKRWNIHPRRIEDQLIIAYENFEYCRLLFKEKYVQLTYENMVLDSSALQTIVEFCDTNFIQESNSHFHKGSISKWKNDFKFRFNLNPRLHELASNFGYSKSELEKNTFLGQLINLSVFKKPNN